jgi:peptidylprolyl isomerase
MKSVVPALLLVAAVTFAGAQTASKSASSAKTGAAKSAAGVKSATAARPAGTAAKLPPGVPPVKGLVTTAFSLRFQEIKLGTGAEAENGKIGKILYTGWRASDGVKFDSSNEHRQPVLDKDGKPELDADGKAKQGDVQPLAFPIGMGRMIPGVDLGVLDMKVGGKRRLFIPYQLAYGTHDIKERDGHPGIPPKSDLIFDIELVEVAEMPARPMGMRPAGGVPKPAAPGTPAPAPGTAPAPGQPAAAPGAAAPATAPTPDTAPKPQQ